MPKERNGLNDQILSHWLPMGKSSHAVRAGRPGSGGGGRGTGDDRMKM